MKVQPPTKEQLAEELEKSNGRKLLLSFLTDTLKKPELITAFDKLTELYFEINSVVNLSALRTVDDIYIKHYLDSLYPINEFNGTVCDVGCGGGFPTIPLAIANSSLDVTGLDSVGKKLLLITRAKCELRLNNLRAIHSRSEDFAEKISGSIDGKLFDTVCARALADVDKALSFCAPLARSGGKIILYRTQNDEIPDKKTLNKNSVTVEKTKDYKLSSTDIKRRLIVFNKL